MWWESSLYAYLRVGFTLNNLGALGKRLGRGEARNEGRTSPRLGVKQLPVGLLWTLSKRVCLWQNMHTSLELLPQKTVHCLIPRESLDSQTS